MTLDKRGLNRRLEIKDPLPDRIFGKTALRKLCGETAAFGLPEGHGRFAVEIVEHCRTTLDIADLGHIAHDQKFTVLEGGKQRRRRGIHRIIPFHTPSLDRRWLTTACVDRYRGKPVIDRKDTDPWDPRNHYWSGQLLC